MLVKKISIQGFRSLKKINLRFDKFGIIIGKNDIGKSSVLLALDIFLNDLKPNREEMSHGATVIEIEITFKLNEDELLLELPELIRLNLLDQTLTISKAFHLDSNDTEKIKTVEVSIKGKKIKPAEYKVISSFFPQYVYVESIRNIEKATKMTPSSILGKLVMPLLLAQDEVSTSVKNLESVISTNISKIVKDIEGYLIEQSPDVRSIVPKSDVMIDKSIDLNLMIDDGFSTTDIGGKGSGIQSSLVVALFRAYAKHHVGKNIVFGIEEPDAYLHVGAQRKIFHSLQSITENDGQAILTTHSTVFIDRGNLKGITLLKRNEIGEVVAKNIKEEHDLTVIQDSLEIKNSDWFQWDAVLMIEGGTEKVVIDIWAKKLGLNLDSMGIKLFVLGGKDKILYAANAKILDDIGIPYAVLLDSDNKDPHEYSGYLVSQTNLTHNNCFILSRREIENYYPKEAVEIAFSEEDLSSIQFEDPVVDIKAQLLKLLKPSEVNIGRKVALQMTKESIPIEVKKTLEWIISKIKTPETNIAFFQEVATASE